MENKKLFEENIIQLNGNISYYVIKETLFENQIYLFANELDNNENPTENIAILKVKKDDVGIQFVYEYNEEIINKLMYIFSSLLEKNE